MALRQVGFTWYDVRRHAAPLLFAGLIGGFVIALLSDRFTGDSVENLRIVPSSVPAGTKANFIFTAPGQTHELIKQCDGVVHRFIVDSQHTVWALLDTSATEVAPVNHGSFDFARQFPVPTGAAPGPAVYHSRVTRWCNPIQQFFWPIASHHNAAFTILAATEETKKRELTP